MTSLRRDDGQAMLFVIFFVVSLVGMLALVLTIGVWFRTHRQLQTAVDASALAAAQQLPCTGAAGDPACTIPTAMSVAASYLSENQVKNPTALADNTPCGTNPSAPAPSCSVTFPSAPPNCAVRACVRVDSAQSAPGPFASFVNGVLGAAGLSPVTVRAHAQATIGSPSVLKNVAPVAVPESSVCTNTNPSCFGSPKTLTVPNGISSSGSAVLNLNCPPTDTAVACNTSPNTNDMTSWIEDGFPDALPVNKWWPAVGGQHVGLKNGLDTVAQAQTPLLFPVYDQANTSVGSYHIIGWSAFLIDDPDVNPNSVDWNGNTKALTGRFVTYIAENLPPGPSQPGTNGFGVSVIWLTD